MEGHLAVILFPVQGQSSPEWYFKNPTMCKLPDNWPSWTKL